MIDRCYLEITNVCNLDCVFCPKNSRPKHLLTDEEFDLLTDRLQGEVKFLYFHLMGEPMLHPSLPDFVKKSRQKDFIPVLTTNGTLLQTERITPLLTAGLHKVQISLHAHEGNGMNNAEEYIQQVMTFAMAAADMGVIVVLRLWNEGGYDSTNQQLLDLLAQYIPQPWTQRYDGWKLTERIYLEFDQMFEWPDEEHTEYGEDDVFCYALRKQIGVLADGSVVPCCLDHDGSIVLGNLYEQPLAKIMASARAQAMYDGFTHHHATEDLCRRCGYASDSKRFRRK